MFDLTNSSKLLIVFEGSNRNDDKIKDE